MFRFHWWTYTITDNVSWQYAKKSGLMYANSRRWAAGDKKCGISGERGWKTPAHCTPGHTLDAAVILCCYCYLTVCGRKGKEWKVELLWWEEKMSSYSRKLFLQCCLVNILWCRWWLPSPSLPDSVVLWWFEEKGVTWYSKLTATLARWSGDWETSVFDLSRLLPCLEKIGLIKRHLIWIQQAITGFLEISLQFCSNTASDSLHKYHDHLPKVVF